MVVTPCLRAVGTSGLLECLHSAKETSCLQVLDGTEDQWRERSSFLVKMPLYCCLDGGRRFVPTVVSLRPCTAWSARGPRCRCGRKGSRQTSAVMLWHPRASMPRWNPLFAREEQRMYIGGIKVETHKWRHREGPLSEGGQDARGTTDFCLQYG